MRPDDFEAVYAGAVALLAPAASSHVDSRQAEAASTAVALRAKVAEAMACDDAAARGRLTRRYTQAYLLVLAAYGDARTHHQVNYQARWMVGLTEGMAACTVTADALVAMCNRGAVLRCPYPLDGKLQITDKGREVLAEMLRS